MPSIELTSISLTYRVFHSVDLSLKSAFRPSATGGLIQRSGRNSVQVAALQDITLSVKDGERIGLVGHNGAGKTTLLKVIAGICKPQQGSIVRRGRTATIINPGNGLVPTATGYENIETIGLLSGLSRAEIRARMPDIEQFTELGDFLKLPVSTYSSGMQTRLAFGVATSLSPDILVADEVLSTGDASFADKARRRMEEMMSRSSLLVFASHDMRSVARLCNRAVLLENGRLVADSTPAEIERIYHASIQRARAQ